MPAKGYGEQWKITKRGRRVDDDSELELCHLENIIRDKGLMLKY